MTEHIVQSTGCCEPFDPAPWENAEISWEHKLFVKDRVTSVFHVPLNFGRVVTKNMKRITAQGATAPHPLMLTDENSLWGADIYIDVTKEVSGATMTELSGTFLTKVFEGPYKHAGKWAEEMRAYVDAQHRTLKKLYFSYTTCPKCAQAYGTNYVVLFAQVDDDPHTSV